MQFNTKNQSLILTVWYVVWPREDGREERLFECDEHWNNEQLTYTMESNKTNSVALSTQANYTNCHLFAKFSANFCG
jgi:hypothetical protein